MSPELSPADTSQNESINGTRNTQISSQQQPLFIPSTDNSSPTLRQYQAYSHQAARHTHYPTTNTLQPWRPSSSIFDNAKAPPSQQSKPEHSEQILWSTKKKHKRSQMQGKQYLGSKKSTTLMQPRSSPQTPFQTRRRSFPSIPTAMRGMPLISHPSTETSQQSPIPTLRNPTQHIGPYPRFTTPSLRPMFTSELWMLPSLSLSANYSPSHPRYVRKLGKPQLLGGSHLKTETWQTRHKTTSTSETKMNTTSNTTPHNSYTPRHSRPSPSNMHITDPRPKEPSSSQNPSKPITSHFISAKFPTPTNSSLLWNLEPFGPSSRQSTTVKRRNAS